MKLFQVINLAREYLVLGIIGLIFIGIIYFIFFRRFLKNHMQTNIKKVIVFCILFCYIVIVIGATIFTRSGVYEHANFNLFSSYIEAWNNKRGIFEVDDIMNNWIGALIGYSLVMFLLTSISKEKTKFKPLKLIIYLLPTLATIFAGYKINDIYNSQRFGNLSSNYNYVYDMSKVSLNSKVELKDDEDKEKKVYTLNRLSAEDALNFAQDFLKKLGTSVDKSNIDTYDNQILYSSSDGRYKIMVYLNGGAYSFTDFNCSDNVINQNMDKESVIAALKKYNVKPCDIAEFEQEKEDNKKLSSYRFYVDLNEKNNKLTDGYLTISQSDEILNIYNYIYTYKSYGKYKIISQEEAYDKIKAGQFNSYELYNIKSILIRSIKLCYQLDSKGYYQPVYRFECTIDGEGRPIFIPALE